ncbi:MAG: fibronectin type III domain-containing protein [Bacillota bacterium]|nr:fibronectin type III domain-containing protein [Bacillota bacterium]
MKSKSKIILALALVLCLASSLFFTNLTASAADATPHTIFVTFYGDAKTQRGFTWYTDIDNLASKVQLATNSSFTDAFIINGNPSVPVQGGDRNNNKGNYYITQYMHKAVVTGLLPGTKYFYKVGDGSTWSSMGSFTTQEANSNSFSFIDVSDTQTSSNSIYTTCLKPMISKAFETVPGASFLLDSGDITNNGGDLVQWQVMADSVSSNIMNTTFVPVAGNHETHTAGGDDNPAGKFVLSNGFTITGSYQNSLINHFNINLPSGETNTKFGAYYSFDYANTHVMILNTNYLNSDGTLSQEQIDWLKSECNSTTAKWKILSFHRSIYSVGLHFSDPEVSAMRTQLPPIIAQCGIDVVLSGHDHTYIRTKPIGTSGIINNTTTVTENFNGVNTTFTVNPQGAVYFNSGAGGDTFHASNYNPTASSSSTNAVDIASLKMLPAFAKYLPTVKGAKLNQINVQTTADLNNSTKNTSYNAPTFAGITISGDKLVFNFYQYNITNSSLALVDTYAIDKTPSNTFHLGDVNLDGYVTLKDCTSIQKYLSGVISLTSNGTILADVNDDKIVSLKDATSIQRWVAGLPSEYNINDLVTISGNSWVLY